MASTSLVDRQAEGILQTRTVKETAGLAHWFAITVRPHATSSS